MTVMSQPTMDDQIPEWTLGWRLQRSLAHADLSVEQMADELGVTRQTVGRWLHERGEPRTAYLRLWALRTGVPLEWLVNGGNEGIRRRGRYTPADLAIAAGAAA
jgi:transcriptional regulator with XRE-family HTH domain